MSKMSKSEEVIAFLAGFRDDDEPLQIHHVLRALDKVPNHGVNFHRNYRITRKGRVVENLYWRVLMPLISQEDRVLEFFWCVLIGERIKK